MLLLLLALVSAQLWLSQGFHHTLTKRELVHTFGVESVAHVPDYQLVTVQRKHLPDGARKLSFQAWDDEFVLHLKPNKKLVSPHLVTVIRDANSTLELKGLPVKDYDCHFIGHVLSHNYSAAVSDCERLHGVIVTDQRFLVLHTVPQRLQTRHGQHLVYKRDSGLINPLEHMTAFSEEPIQVDKGESRAEFCDVDTELAQVPTTENGFQLGEWSRSQRDVAPDQLLHLNYTVPSEAQLDSLFIFPQLDPITLEIGLFLDSELYEHFKREFTGDPEKHLTDFSLALINNVHVLYQQPTLSPNLDIVIVRFEMWKTQPPNLATHLHKNGQAQTLLDSFCRHQARINPGTDLTDPGHWDHGVLLTGYDIYHTTPSVAGVAPVARMCDDLFACSLVEGLHLGRSFVLAHEMGHNMGMVHDGVQNQCGRSCCLMSAVNGAGKTTWSTCSVREFNAFMLQLDESGRGNCLRDPAEGISSHNHLSDGRLPGQRFTADQQCSYFWGRDYQVEIPNGRSMDDICRILWCGNSGSTISTAHPALEGSWCGGDKWCQEGQCQEWRSPSPKPVIVNGGWSSWSSGDKQCAISPCQISGSIAVNAQLRTCTNPAPNNGGTQCLGSSIRGLVCGSTGSECKGSTHKEYADRICSNIKNDSNKPDRQLSGVGFMHATQPCKVWCHVSGSEVIRNKGQFPNGTPCGHGNYCKLQCNGKALTSGKEDCPDEGVQAAKPSGRWEPWSDWSSCSATCGVGVQKRWRECKGQCQGKPTELRTCEAQSACEEYSAWSDWSNCSATCGRGVEESSRKCLSAPNCKEPVHKQRECVQDECPVWSSWEEWSVCDSKCGKQGNRRRKRSCASGKPKECAGNSEDVEHCQGVCDKTGEWGPWQTCSVSCGIGFQLRERVCDGVACGGKQARTCSAQQCLRSSDRPIWSEWSLWSPCSLTCGQGVQSRTKQCLNDKCDTNKVMTEEKRCVLRPCPTWALWGAWSSCASCTSEETRTRKRVCVIGLVLLGAEAIEIDAHNCPGKSQESSPCDQNCSAKKEVLVEPALPVDQALNHWLEWESWQSCSASCGKGFRQRTRACSEGFNCTGEGLGFQVEECSEQDCDSSWGSWSSWSSCSAACGTGTRTRTRKCLAFLSLFCSGSPTEEEQCTGECATNQDLLVPKWSEWSAWSSCSCFTLKQFRRRFCEIKDPAVQGFCAGSLIEQRPCQPDSCLAITGSWSEWSEWSKCSKDCGIGGHQIRNRMCSNPLPANRGGYCVGYSFDQRLCHSEQKCAAEAVDGKWSAWTEWSPCSDPCQNGQRSRTRFCTNPKPKNNGKQCIGNDFELQPCLEVDKCGKSVSGSWSQWSQWSNCSSQCGFSYKHRERTCSSPVPSNPRHACPGLAHLTALCRTDPCPQEPKDGQWSDWSTWSHCTAHCGEGIRTRMRSCSVPVDSGSPCFGPSAESESCTGPQLCTSSANHSLTLDSLVLATL